MHVKKGDKVLVIAGKEKGKTSTVVRTLRVENKVVLEGLNMVKKHKKASKATGAKGTMIDIAMPIHASNVKLVDSAAKSEKPAAKKATKKAVKKAE